MRCDDILPLVEKLADGECTEAEKTRAEAHLAACTSCQAHLRFLQALPEAARRSPLPEPPGVYWDVLPRKVMARIREESAHRRREWLSGMMSPAALRWLGALAAGAVVIVLSYEVLNLQQEKQPTPAESVKEPVLEESVRPEPSPTEPEVLPGAAEETADQEKLLAGGALQANPPFSPAEGISPPVRPRTVARRPPSGVAGAPQKQEVAEGIADVAGSREPAPVALGVAADRVQAPTEEIPAPAAMERMEELDEAPVPRAPAPPPPGMEGPEEPLQQRSKAEVPARRADELEESSERRPASQVGRSFSRAALSEKDRETVSELELEGKCTALRNSLDPSKKSDEQEDIRYRLARCSIELYQLRRTEEDRRRAVEEASAYLEVYPEGERADEIRKLRELIQSHQ